MATQKTQAPVAVAADATTVTANTPITYDGKPIAPGERFDVRPADLAQLLAVKAVTVDQA